MQIHCDQWWVIHKNQQIWEKKCQIFSYQNATMATYVEHCDENSKMEFQSD